ncbi:S-(hydroxymethyl)glutathione dehydrogenase / alcohol dehydrogenase [Parafrankia irregularis]|uniref:S-(Hydroxymethyl)glutathione dehydrogenase / alcohol dehydrogenase n=1 Tax=Parafrankia irregularis TaxID=795642 RepID=A0A0S4QNZ9_9ACTN|nr:MULTISPECIES: NDMA-dependent alcohol dehydrogenase [Parafrankia]MBE3201343.1 NDMA-dependent alcohol dehydrogenase [Parafrankia sp. CH37]CUU56202.1 S-(hydroxymethyl)glutathione dehydrogenase / alcohol dehydrogenase [Parafrankia irregularis]
MQTQAAVLWGVGEPWKIEDVTLDEPRRGEIRVRLAASGLCHTDEHLVTGDIPGVPYPIIGGHEGAGVVDAVGPGVDHLAEGDHVVLTFIPACGVCAFCVSGHQNLCDNGAHIMTGRALSDGGYRVHVGDQDVSTYTSLGTFSPYVVVNQLAAIRIDDDIPLDKAALVGCGVTTGWGTAVNAADVRLGQTVVVIGCGGLGISAVQGARAAGATEIVAIDPVEFKRTQALRFGATHAAENIANAAAYLVDRTRGVMADAVMITSSLAAGEMIGPAMGLAAKRGRVVVTSTAPRGQETVTVSLAELTFWEKQVRGCLWGSANPRTAIPELLDLYRRGVLKLDEMITRTYRLDQINDGYDDLRNGRNIRGVVLFD